MSGELSGKAAIAGIGATDFSKDSGRSELRLASEAVLDALDADLLAASRCYFGGGTAIALRYGEFRESVDIDFLVSSRSGYSRLRQLVRQPTGFNALTRRPVTTLRPVVADRYGIRTLLDAGGEPI